MFALVVTPPSTSSTLTCAVRLAVRIGSLYCATGLASVPPAVFTMTFGTALMMSSWNGAR